MMGGGEDDIINNVGITAQSRKLSI